MAPRTSAVLILLVIVGSSVANVAQTASVTQSKRKLLSTTTTWGSHHPGEVCYGNGLLTSLLKPLLRQIKVYVDANLNILCIDLLWVDLSLLEPLLLLVDLPLTSTNYCPSLIGIDVKAVVVVDLNLGAVVNGILGVLESVTYVKGIWADNGTLLALYLETSLGQKKWCGNSAALGAVVELKLGVGHQGFQSKYCRSNNLLSLIEWIV